MHSSSSNSRRGSSAHAVALSIAVVACAGALPARAAECPVNEIKFVKSNILTSAPSFTTPIYTDLGLPAYIAYDLRFGTLHVHHFPGLLASWVRVNDLYDVTGVPAGTAVPVMVELTVNGWVSTVGCGGAGCWGSVAGEIVTPTDAQSAHRGVNLFLPGTRSLTFSVQASLVLVAGVPTPVSFLLDAYQDPGGQHAAEGDGTFRFVGLPPGGVVTSCQGFAEPTTPAAPSSWGRLKAAYR